MPFQEGQGFCQIDFCFGKGIQQRCFLEDELGIEILIKGQNTPKRDTHIALPQYLPFVPGFLNMAVFRNALTAEPHHDSIASGVSLPGSG